MTFCNLIGCDVTVVIDHDWSSAIQDGGQCSLQCECAREPIFGVKPGMDAHYWPVKFQACRPIGFGVRNF